ncbi:hypothetical protein [Jiangella sp. DSM 45060]|uniref:hypothetical protein n=1 Tax=Jiangella sp. DSM 45060 TaxID=1798224 RepID=UPI000879F17B|nr:hypothetical protein [Jiangella sp. DSM 45060]SDS64478.1 hypothetical protein SAMN04515669_1570 [Jiangella sp. DSM 45060]
MSADRPPDGGLPSEATLREFVTALHDVATAITQHTTELHDDRRRGDGDRPASAAQRRAVLDYRVLGALTGRLAAGGVLVSARRFQDKDRERVELQPLPATAARVAVQAAGEKEPELLGIDRGSGSSGTVTLDRTRGKDIARLEVWNGAGQPIRLGPRLPRLPAQTPVD